jgi:hypothetical protein
MNKLIIELILSVSFTLFILYLIKIIFRDSKKEHITDLHKLDGEVEIWHNGKRIEAEKTVENGITTYKVKIK